MYQPSNYASYEFLRPLVQAWRAKIECALQSDARKKWKEVAEECHDDKTEVLTDRGWKLFGTLTGEELLATVNLTTDTIEFQKPSKLTARPSNGEMVRFSGKALDALVTPRHRMVYFPPHSSTPGLKEARDILRSDQLKLTARNWVGTTPVLPEFLKDVDPADFAEWLGFYIAEGWCANYRVNNKKTTSTYQIGIAQRKPEGVRYYEQLAEKMPFRTPPYQARQGVYLFSHKKMWHYLKQFGDGAHSKIVPQWVKDAPQEIIKAFLRGYLAGDGNVAADGSALSCTASKELADGIQELWLKIGQSAAIRERQPAPYSFNEGDRIRSGMSGKLYLVKSWKTNKRASLKRHNGSEIELMFHKEAYGGMVYCATVPNGTLITRRNGLPLISGNCLMFYSKSAAAMWDKNYSRKFWQNVNAPKFRITINKAFEFVAIFGPNLLWDTPHRTVNPKRRQQYSPDLFAEEPNGQALFEMLSQRDAHDLAVSKGIASVLQPWLNYTARETPGGGLAGQSAHAVTDSLIKGRGVLWSETYQFPASGRTLVGSFHDDPENLIIDPDFKTLDKARVIYRKRVWPHWQVERHFGLPVGSLKGKATLESSYSYGEYHGTEDNGNADRVAGKTNDLICFYEVFSKCGVGAALTNMEENLKQHLSKVTGDYVYLAICDKCPWPLNCPSEVMLNGATDEEIKKRFEWPVPFWTDDRWPMECLDHYLDPEGAYPVPPLAPALGEIKLLNFLVPWTIQHAHNTSKLFWAVAGQHVEHYKKHLENLDDLAIIPSPPGVDDVRKAIQQFEQKQTTADSWRVIEFVSTLIDKRTGLTEQAYGRNEDGTQNRTAEETIAKQRAVGVRSEHMQKTTKDWQSRVESQEAFLSRMFVNGEDVEGVLGSVGRFLWERYVMSTDVEKVARGMEYEVGAASIRRPDRERDIANFQTFSQYLLPGVQTYAETTGNYKPFNWYIQQFGEFHDMDVEGAMIPEPTEEEQAAKQQQQQLADAQMQAETEAKKAEAALKMSQAATAGNEQAAAQQALQLDAAKASMEMQSRQQEGQLKIAETQANLQAKREELGMKMQEQRFKTLMDLVSHRQQMQMDQDSHEQEMEQGEQQGKQQLKLNKQMTDAKAKAAAKAKPAPAKK